MNKAALLQDSFFHYKYTTTERVTALIGKRSARQVIELTNGPPMPYGSHTVVLATDARENFFENMACVTHKVIHANPTTTIDIQPRNGGHYVSAVLVPSFRGGSHFDSRIDFELTADEYRRETKVTDFFSDLIKIAGSNFSLVLPLKSITTSSTASSETSATLNLIHGATVKAYDPYSFTEDDHLRKVNELPHGSGQVEYLFHLKT